MMLHFKKPNADKIGTPQNPDMPVSKQVVSQYQHNHQQKPEQPINPPAN